MDGAHIIDDVPVSNRHIRVAIEANKERAGSEGVLSVPGITDHARSINGRPPFKGRMVTLAGTR